MAASPPRILASLLVLVSQALLPSCSRVGLKSGDQAAKAPTPKVLVISVDGLRTDLFQPVPGTTAEMPILQRLAKEGAFAHQGVLAVYPTVTYPNHVSLVTGVRTAAHGIISNKMFTIEKGSSAEWYWEASRIRALTLWQAARKQGKTVLAVGWPVSVGANVTWNIPEIFPQNGFDSKEIWELTRDFTREELWQEVTAAAGDQPFASPLEKDQWLLKASLHLLKKHQPDLSLIHLTWLDLAQHFTGRDSAATHEAARLVDSWIAQILETVDRAATIVFIVGDHGFRDTSQLLHVNTIFTREGWITLNAKNGVSQWKVLGHLSGAQMAVYSRDPALNAKVLDLLKRNAKGRYRILSRRELDELKAFPGALCALEPATNYGIGGRLSGELLEKLPKPHGEHGFLPQHPQMLTSLIIHGPGVTPGKELGQAQLIDVAPTVARALRIPFPEVEGQPISYDH